MRTVSDRVGGLWGLPAFLRTWGIEASAEDLALALRALSDLVGADAWHDLDVKHVEMLLRPVFARNLGSWERFPGLFEAFLRGEEPAMAPGGGPADVQGRIRERRDEAPGTASPELSDGGPESRAKGAPTGPDAETGSAGETSSAGEEKASATGVGTRPGRPVLVEGLGSLFRRYHELTLPPPGRRYRSAPRGGRIRLGDTLALSRRTGGEPIRLALEAPRPPRPHRVLLVDTSTSMDAQEGFLERFARGMQRPPVEAEVYGFAVRLFAWRRHGGEGGALWAGGTRIGESLLQYLHGPGRHLTRRSHVMVVSDGWETGDIRHLTQALAGLSRRAGRVDWLCPIAASEGFEPTCRGLRAALQSGMSIYDVHDVASFARYLEGFRRRPSGPGSVLEGWHPARRRGAR